MTYWTDRTKSNDDGCWVWQQSTTNSGYGACKGTTAHKLSYVEHVGPVPKGQVVRHSCDNKLCCNPAHLTLGTQRDNYFDMSEEKRLALHVRSGLAQRGKSLDPEMARKAGRASKGCKRKRTAEHNRKIAESLRRRNGT